MHGAPNLPPDRSGQALDLAEDLLFERYGGEADHTAVFLVGAPRTGSTLCYQLINNVFHTLGFTNFVASHFSCRPLVGVALQSAFSPGPDTPYESAYGKTDGTFGLSEASPIFARWFGGEHPSQMRSREFLADKEAHFVKTVRGIHAMTGRPLLTKNAWNCFRIAAIARALPTSLFIWMRRDVRASAVSDLEARLRRGGPTVWNSATTANYREIQRLPHWEQVVEQQHEYNKAIDAGLRQCRSGHHAVVWYEDLCHHTTDVLGDLQAFFRNHGLPLACDYRKVPRLRASNGPSLMAEDAKRIAAYVKENEKRFLRDTYHDVDASSTRQIA